MQSKARYSYLELIEDYKDLETYNLFEKVLIASTRAKDLQQLQSVQDPKHPSAGYTALQELKNKKIHPLISSNQKIKPEEDEEN